MHGFAHGIHRSSAKKAREVYLIICEGKQTEPGYFNRVRTLYGLSNIHVYPGTTATDYRSVLQRGMQLCAQTEVCDYAYIVCDGDSLRRVAVEPEARVRTATSRQYAILRSAITKPCFEYWLLLHFDYTDAAINCAEATDRLMRHWPTYAKRSDIFEFIERQHIERAMENARRLKAQAGRITDVSTDLGELLDKIIGSN